LEQDSENIWTPRDETVVGWRQMHNEKLHNLYSSPNIIRMIESKGMKWTGNVERMGKECIQILVRKPEERRPTRKITHKRKGNTKMDLNQDDLGHRPEEGSCRHGNEPSDSIKCWEFLEKLLTSTKGLSSIQLIIFNHNN
jgi:hypothetical protein